MFFIIQTASQHGLAQPTLLKRPQDTLLISPSGYIHIQDIQWTGNYRTKNHIILRELNILPGDSIPIANLDSILSWERNRLFNTNLFVTVDAYIRADSTGKNILRIVLKEQWYTIPQPIFDLADRNPNEWLYQRGAALDRVNIGLRMYQRNCRGRNETLRLTVQGGFTDMYNLSYDIPYLNKKQRIGASVFTTYYNNRSISYATQDHTLMFVESNRYLRFYFKAGFNIKYRHAFFGTHQIELSHHNHRVGDTVALLNPDYFLNGNTLQRYTNIKYKYTYDIRDIRQYATKGYHIKFEAERSGILPFENANQWRASLTWAQYLPLQRNFFYAYKLRGSTSAPSKQPYNLFFGLGYDQDYVRGYELYPIDGHHTLLHRNSLRHKTYSAIWDFGRWVPLRQFRTLPIDIFLTAFADWGYVVRYDPHTFNNTRLSNTPLGGTGIGIHIVTFYNSVFRAEYSINHLKQLNFFISMATDI